MSLAADLSLLSTQALDDRGITAHIASRFHQGMPFSTISTRTLIAVNTFAPFDLNQDQVFRDFAARVVHRMQARGESQVVVFEGESGSGKSEFARALTGHVLTLAGNPLSSRARKLLPILEAFTTAKTAGSLHASKMGTLLELQYDSQEALVGAAVSDYRLERQRVTRVPTNERNFNVFYQLYAGLTQDEKYHLQLNDPAVVFRYLGHPSQLKIAGIDDKKNFKNLKTSLLAMGFSRADVANIFQVLAAILHLGQIQFRPTGTDSSVAQTMAVEIQNPDILDLVASFLGVLPEVLGTCLVSKTVQINKDRVTVVLDQRGARENCDEVARTLYTMLLQWILDRINSALSVSSGDDLNPLVHTTLSIMDFPGFSSSSSSALDRLLYNSANELVYNYMLHVYFQKNEDVLSSDDIEIAKCDYFNNEDAVKALVRPRTGLLSVIDDYTRRQKDSQQLLDSLARRFENSPVIYVDKVRASFLVKHYDGQVEYSTQHLLQDGTETITGDILSIFTSSTSSDFLKKIFEKSAVVDDTFGNNNQVIAAHISSEPRRQPSLLQSGNSLLRRGPSTRTRYAQDEPRPTHGEKPKKKLEAAGKFVQSIDKMIESFDEANCYFVICLKPNDHRNMSSLDARCVRQQVVGYGIPELAKRTKQTDHSIFMPFNEYLRYAVSEPSPINESERDYAIRTIQDQGWPSRDICYGTTGVFISENAWLQLTDPNMTFAEAAAQKFATGGEDNFYDNLDNKSIMGGYGNMFRNANQNDEFIHLNDDGDVQDLTAPVQESRERKNWLAIVWFYTWYIPDIAIKKIGKMPFKSVRIAWREKLTINLIIWGMCVGCMLFLIGFPYLICPLQDVFSEGELTEYTNSTDNSKVYTSIRGVVYDIQKFSHQPALVPKADVFDYGGKDSSDLFPLQISGVCAGIDGQGVSEFLGIGDPTNYTDSNALYHDFRSWTNDSRPDWYLTHMHFFNQHYRKGYLGYTPKDIKKMYENKQKIVASMDGFVYDLTDYVNGNLFTRAPAGYVPPPDIDRQFLDQSVVSLFTDYTGQDVTSKWKELSLSSNNRFHMNRCLRNLFLIGKLDTRGSARCLFARYFLLSVTCFVVFIIVVKFVAALQFGGYEYPDDLDKFIICQVPAYTEDEQSLRRAIDSLARTNYDDKRKLLVVICDGMIVGAGNEKPTPRIVLDILGAPENADPPAYPMEALGEGDKQYNVGKIYTGLYEVGGHIVPYLVIVKVGKPTETFRPGNRGKRDSQMILMRFLNRVHYNAPMNPFELELYHQIQDIIGVAPSYYEYLMQVDADTVVSPESLSQLTGAMVNDNKLQAICGETALSNARHSMVTMIQVYEYYISHNLAKAFESLFGSVTCLPGCFSLYRLYDNRTGNPVFVSTPIITGYSENQVRTLHTKNLLHLGEDRYLTTLMLKHNPLYKTKYLRHAHAYTVAPDSWEVFLSQRRRWINSTVHNMVELVPMGQMCGFCCFSMRFIVMVDLFSTLIQPVTCAYIAYLIYLCVTREDDVPYTSIAMIAAIYGLQMIVFLLRRKWEMIGWMFVYILAIPIFSLALPLYSFWYMDDFSWGNTRMVVGEKGEKIIVTDEGHFDPSTIPLKRWTDYQNEVWNKDDDEMSTYNNPSRQSVPASPGRTMTMATGFSEYEVNDGASQLIEPLSNQPSDSDITEAIREILATADLAKLTKRTIRMQLENQFKCNLSMRREYISHVTEALLSGEL